MSYFVAPLSKVKTNFSEFHETMANLETAVRSRAEAIWPGYTFGGLNPGKNQYGLANIPPRHMSVPRGFGSWSYMQKYTAPGSWMNIFSYTIPRDQIHGFAGFGFIAPNLVMNAIRLTLSETIYPVMEIEEAHSYAAEEGVALIFKTDKGQELVAQELTGLILRGFQERNTSGWNVRVVPIGMIAYRVKDDLIGLSAPAT